MTRATDSALAKKFKVPPRPTAMRAGLSSSKFGYAAPSPVARQVREVEARIIV